MAYLEYRPNSPLFVYTDIAGFEGVIRSKKLWLSDVTALNDPRELVLGRQMLSDAIDQFDNYKMVNVTKREMASFLADLFRFQRLSTCYACCFALAGDELPMWKGYADGGKGVSVGFRPTAISSIPGRMQLVRYDDESAPDFFKSIVIQAAMTMGQPQSIERIIATSGAFAAVSSFKHRTWQYEKEARIIYNQRHMKPDPQEIRTHFTGAHSDGTLFKWQEPLVRWSRNREVKYFAFDYGRLVKGKADPKRSIEVVLRGPNCEMSAEEINALLIAEGFEEFSVRESDCSFI